MEYRLEAVYIGFAPYSFLGIFMLRSYIETLFKCFLAVILIAIALLGSASSSQNQIGKFSEKKQTEKSCILIDTDFDIDDMMAIPLVVANRNVTAIITTEGCTLAPQGASALSRLLAEPSIYNPIPIIIGANYPGNQDLSKWPWLPAMRAAMQQANGLLADPLIPRKQEKPYAVSVKEKLAHCDKVSILILGPFTSFVKYSPEIQSKVDLIVMQGRPRYADNSKIQSKISFNCEYDLSACETAFDQMKSMKAQKVWVDVPRDIKPLYTPTLEMVQGLDSVGLPGALKQALLGNQTTWNLNAMPKGASSYLWDQLATLYLLHPQLYKTMPGGTIEPTVPALEIQRLWIEDTNRRVSG